MILELILFLVASLSIFALWMGVFKKMKIEEKHFYGGVLAYVDYRDEIKNIGKAHTQIGKDLDLFKTQHVLQGKALTMGIYYDDPYNLKRPNEFRATLGILFVDRNVQAENFFKIKGYKIKALPKVNSIYGEFPYKCFLSYSLAPIKFYPASLEYIGRNKTKYGDLFNPCEPSGSIELYEGNLIKFYFPLSNRSDFYLTKDPAPEMKDNQKYSEMIESAK